MGDVILVAVLALPLIGFWLLIRGQQRRAAEAARLAVEPPGRAGRGDHQRPLRHRSPRLDETEVTLLVAPGVELRFDRRAIGRVSRTTERRHAGPGSVTLGLWATFGVGDTSGVLTPRHLRRCIGGPTTAPPLRRA